MGSNGTVRGMRHLGSLVAALIITPLAWVLLALGQPRVGDTLAGMSRLEPVPTGRLGEPLLLIGVAGVLIGLIACLRWSPLGPLVAGSVLLAAYAVLLLRPFVLLDRLP